MILETRNFRNCWLTGVCAVLVASYGVVEAQVPVQQEPHHKTVFENAQLRILDVNIRPGETTLEHSHINDLLSVSISASETRTTELLAGDRPRRVLGEITVTLYAGRRSTHAVENVGGNLFRLIAVENFKQEGWSTEGAAVGPGITVLNESRSFRAYSVQLRAGGNQVDRVHRVPSIVVLVTGQAQLFRKDGQQLKLDESIRWAVIGASEPFKLSTRGPDDARLVEIEIR